MPTMIFLFGKITGCLTILIFYTFLFLDMNFLHSRKSLHYMIEKLIVMADIGGCIIYLLSLRSMWEAHKTLSSVSSYPNNVLGGRNKIKIEPVVESDYDKNCKKLNEPQEEKHLECEVCTKLFNKKDKLIYIDYQMFHENSYNQLKINFFMIFFKFDRRACKLKGAALNLF